VIPALQALAAVGTFLGGCAAIGALLTHRRVRRLEATPPYRSLAKAQAERDSALRENVRLRAECRRLLTECSELKKALQEALREILRLTRKEHA
jgi:hypothetical protein